VKIQEELGGVVALNFHYSQNAEKTDALGKIAASHSLPMSCSGSARRALPLGHLLPKQVRYQAAPRPDSHHYRISGFPLKMQDEARRNVAKLRILEPQLQRDGVDSLNFDYSQEPALDSDRTLILFSPVLALRLRAGRCSPFLHLSLCSLQRMAEALTRILTSSGFVPHRSYATEFAKRL